MAQHAHKFRGILSSYSDEGAQHKHTVVINGVTLKSTTPWSEEAPEGGHVHRLVYEDDVMTSSPPVEKKKKAVWSGQYINRLPDSAFLYIEPGGKKDADGKTVPRSLRHFPVRDDKGKLDIPHLRNALSRIPQSKVPQAAKDKASAEAKRLLSQATSEQNKSAVVQEFPFVLTKDAVAQGYMPSLGDSELPWTLERVTPVEHRFWELEDIEKASGARDALVELGWFTLHNTAVVDGLLQKVVKETYLYEPEPAPAEEEVEKAQIIQLFKTEKSDDEERYVLGVVLEPNDGAGAPLKPDTQGDIYSAEEVRQACHLFMEKFQNMGHMHRKLVNKKVKLVECYIAPATFKIKDPYGNEITIHKGTWLMGVHIVDQKLWKKVKEDDLTGFSIGGSAQRLPEKVAALESFVDDDEDEDIETLQAA